MEVKRPQSRTPDPPVGRAGGLRGLPRACPPGPRPETPLLPTAPEGAQARPQSRAYAAASCPRRCSTARRLRPWRRRPGAAARTCPRTSRSPASCLWKGGTVDGAQRTQREPRGPCGVPRTGAGARAQGTQPRVQGVGLQACLCWCEFSGSAGQAGSCPLGSWGDPGPVPPMGRTWAENGPPPRGPPRPCRAHGGCDGE